MDAISYTNARKNLKDTMEQVCDQHTPVIITRQKAEPVVLMSLDDYNSSLGSLIVKNYVGTTMFRFNVSTGDLYIRGSIHTGGTIEAFDSTINTSLG